MLREKEEAEKLRDSQTLRKNQEKMSIAMIKDQYNENLKSFKDQVTYEINYKFHNMEQALKEAQRKADRCEERMVVAEKSQNQNKLLLAEIQRLKRQLQSEQGKNSSFLIEKELSTTKNELLIWEDKYKDLSRRLAQNEQDYLQKEKDRERYYEEKIRIKDAKI